jgi:hypothetical protein
MKAWFKDQGLDVNDPRFLEYVPPECHNQAGGLHSNQNGPGTNWNARWQQFIDLHPGGATIGEILAFLQLLKQQFAPPLNCG